MDAPKLLSDEQMRTFLTRGFLVLKTDLPRSFHAEIREQCDKSVEKGHSNPGNNILPHVPQLQAVFDCPTVNGALTSVLGRRYFMHPHRHMHSNKQSNGGGWHKDSYWGYHARIRNHRPWWVMIMYYPQDVRPEDGPTGVIPGTHCHLTRHKDDELGAGTVCGEAGTCFMIHYDIWHRATPNTSGVNRQMLKFEFMRLEAPQSPAWNCTDRTWRDPSELPRDRHRGLWRQSWNFLSGARRPADRGDLASFDSRLLDALKNSDGRVRMDAADQLEACGPTAAEAIPQLIATLNDEFESAAINASYALAAIGKSAIPALIQTLRGESERASLNAAYALSAMGAEAVPALLDSSSSSSPAVRSAVCFALGEIRDTDGDVIGTLARAAKDSEARVRLHAVEALGMKGAAAKSAIPALIDNLQDTDTEVRFNAVLSLARLGPEAASATQALAAALNDPDRYVRSYAVEALHQIGTRDAFDVLIPYLKAARWCTSTVAGSLF